MTEASGVCHLARPSCVFKSPCLPNASSSSDLKLEVLGASFSSARTVLPCGAGRYHRIKGCWRGRRSQGRDVEEGALEQASCRFPEAPRSPECCAYRTPGPESLQQRLGWRDPRGPSSQGARLSASSLPTAFARPVPSLYPCSPLGVCGRPRLPAVPRWSRCLDATPGWGRMFGCAP